MDTGTAERLRSAFPSAAARDIDAALAVIPPCDHAPTERDIGPIRLAGELLHIPCRIYSPEPPSAMLDALDGNAKTIVGCLYTRHHDGHVREKSLRAVIASPLSWVPPYVLQLLGEYVIEIQCLIEANIASLHQPSYARFVAENEDFMELTRQRVISYWDCYFTRPGERLVDHVGYRVLKKLGTLREAAQPGAEPDGPSARGSSL